MKLLISATMAALFAMAVPAWADRGHGYGKPQHAYRIPPGHVKQLHRHHVYRHWHPAPVRHYYTQTYVYPAYPVYPPAPGVHIVLPDVYIPF